MPRLSDDARAAIVDPANDVLVSAASAWEIVIKSRIRNLKAPDSLEAQLEEKVFTPLEISIAHALRAGSLPLHHSDPFDRMLVAQAQHEGLTIVTRDSNIARYDVATLTAQ